MSENNKFFLCAAYNKKDQLIFEAGVEAESMYLAQKTFNSYLSTGYESGAIYYTNIDTTFADTKIELMKAHCITGLFFLEVVKDGFKLEDLK